MDLNIETIDYRTFDIYDPKWIQEIKEIAMKLGGECLSEAYISAQTKLHFRCNCGNEWWATPNNIKGGKWCPKCGGTQKYTLEDMKKLAKKKGGVCLSKEYIDVKSKLKWRCAEGHEWEATPDKILRNRWCHECGGFVKGTIEEYKILAQKRGGKCLSEEYINANTKLHFECVKGHDWWTKPSSVKAGHWCHSHKVSPIEMGHKSIIL